MLPELNFKHLWGIDESMYFERKLKEFFVQNKDVKEPISRYNVQALRQIRTAREGLYVQRRKFGMLFHVAISTKDRETISHVSVIHSSIKEQISMLNNLDKYVKNVRIDEIWAKCLEKFVCAKVNERCERLEKNILPDLIKYSIVNIYDYYLRLNGKTLEQDIIDHLDDEDDVYYEHIMSTIEYCRETYPEVVEKLESARREHTMIQEARRETFRKEKEKQKLEKRQNFEKDASVVLQNWATDMLAIEQQADGSRIKWLYKHVFQRLEPLNDKLTGEDVKFTIVAVARYSGKNKIATSSFRWLHINQDGEYALVGGLGGAEPFFKELEPEKWEKAIQYCREKKYVIAVVESEVIGKKDEPISYDYYQDVPSIKFKKYTTFYENALDDRITYVHRLFHDTICTLQCAYMIREAYDIYGDDTHKINKNLDLKLLRSNMHEIMEFENLENDFFKYSKKSDCTPVRSRMKFLKTTIEFKIQDGFSFPLIDENEQWIEIIKSVVNLNSYTDNDLKRLYDVLESLSDFEMPNEFTTIDGEYCKEDGIYYKRKTYASKKVKIKYIEYARAYAFKHGDVFKKDLFVVE
jgi:hypothetical protein